MAYGLGGTIVDVGIKLPTDFDITFLKKGNVLCDPEHPIKLVKVFIARIVVYELGELGKLMRGINVMVHTYSAKCPGKISSFVAVVDQTSG